MESAGDQQPGLVSNTEARNSRDAIPVHRISASAGPFRAEKHKQVARCAMNPGFALWLTGLPASGKTSIARCLLDELREHGIHAVHIESDEFRKLLTPNPTYSPEERDWFYGVLVFFAEILTSNGLNVILDATANKRSYRLNAKKQMVRFMEVYVRCPVETCLKRDPKGIYSHGLKTPESRVPGLQETYEEPENPDLIVETETIQPNEAARMIYKKLALQNWIA